MTMVVSDIESVKNAQSMSKYKVGIFDFASCEGCELQIANLEEDILELLDTVEVVSFREVMKEHSDDYDIAFIEGSINRPVDEKRLKEIRANAKILIALGDCATTGCVNKLRNQWPDAENLKEVYADADIANNEYFDVFPTKKLNEVVDVDFYIRGCPVRKEQVLYYIRRLTTMAPRKNLDLRFGVTARELESDTRSIIQYDPQKCILCRHCDVVCNDILDIHAIGLTNKGNESIISTPFNKGLDDNKCISCGQCLVNCPVGAFSDSMLEQPPDQFRCAGLPDVCLHSSSHWPSPGWSGHGHRQGCLCSWVTQKHAQSDGGSSSSTSQSLTPCTFPQCP